MAPDYAEAFVSYLNDNSAITVKRAGDGQPIMNGICYLRSGDIYITISPEGRNNKLRGRAKPSHFVHKGSNDMLFFSVAEAFANRSTRIVLSDSGKDGVGGIRKIKRVGEDTIVHDPETYTEPGMPEAALQRSTGHRVSARYEISRIHKLSLVP